MASTFKHVSDSPGVAKRAVFEPSLTSMFCERLVMFVSAWRLCLGRATLGLSNSYLGWLLWFQSVSLRLPPSNPIPPRTPFEVPRPRMNSGIGAFSAGTSGSLREMVERGTKAWQTGSQVGHSLISWQRKWRFFKIPSSVEAFWRWSHWRASSKYSNPPSLSP